MGAEDGVRVGEVHGESGPHEGGSNKGTVTLGERARTVERKDRKVESERTVIAGERGRTLHG